MKKNLFLSFLLILAGGIFSSTTLFAQARKAIPSGRYEALSGIKNSRMTNNDSRLAYVRSESSSLFWHEVMLVKPKDVLKVDYFTKSNLDDSVMSFFVANAIQKTQFPKSNTTIFYTDDLARDLQYMKENRSKFLLFVLQETTPIEKKLDQLKDFEVLLYQAQEGGYQYLLKVR